MAAAGAGERQWSRGSRAPRPPADGAVRLFLLRGRRLVADAVSEALRDDPRLQVVDSAAGGPPLDRLRLAAADVVLVDASDDREGALDCVRRLRDTDPQRKVLAFGLADGVEEALVFAEAGARACVARDAALGEMALAIHELHRDRTPCPPRLVDALIGRVVQLERETGDQRQPGEAPLTERQREVLTLLVDGFTNKEIAQCLGVAVATVKNHVHGLLGRLGVHRRQDAVRIAYLTGLVDDFLPRRPDRREPALRLPGGREPEELGGG